MVSPGVEGTALLYPVHCALRQQVASGSMQRGRSRGSRGNVFPLRNYQLAVSGEYHEEDGGKHHEEDESAASRSFVADEPEKYLSVRCCSAVLAMAVVVVTAAEAL